MIICKATLFVLSINIDLNFVDIFSIDIINLLSSCVFDVNILTHCLINKYFCN